MSKPQQLLESILLGVGYSEDEVKVYLATLMLGSRPVSIIAKEIGFRRSKTYDVIRKLLEKGLLQEYSRNKVLHFSAVKPSTLLSTIRNQREHFDSIIDQLTRALPALEVLNLKSVNKTKLELWRGDDAMCAIMEETFDHPNSTMYYLMDYSTCWPKGRDKKYIDWDKRFTEKRTKSNISIHSICNRSPDSDEANHNASKFKRSMRMIENFNLPFEVAIHIDQVRVICSGREVSGIVIRDPEIAQVFQTLFQAVWSRLPEYSVKNLSK